MFGRVTRLLGLTNKSTACSMFLRTKSFWTLIDLFLFQYTPNGVVAKLSIINHSVLWELCNALLGFNNFHSAEKGIAGGISIKLSPPLHQPFPCIRRGLNMIQLKYHNVMPKKLPALDENVIFCWVIYRLDVDRGFVCSLVRSFIRLPPLA